MASRERLEWLDTARGMAVILVVLYHAVLFAESISDAGGAWTLFISFFQPLRLPLLFFVSGILSSASVGRSWGWVARNRAGTLLWCYAVWTALTFAVFGFVPYTRPDPPGRGVLPMLESLLLPHTGMWYLLSLAAMVLTARLLRCVPPWLVLSAALLVSVAAGSDLLGPGLWWSWANTLSYALFFFLGLAFRAETIRLVSLHARPRTAILLAAAYVLGTSLAAYFGLHKIPGVATAISVLAVCASLLAAAVVSGRSWAAWMTRIGAMTLPVYVTHEILIGCLAAAVQLYGMTVPFGGVLPLVFSVVAVLAGIWLHRIAGTVPGIFRTPWGASARQPERAGSHGFQAG